MNDTIIGQQIKHARVEANLTQSELGERIGVTWEMVSRYENGKSSPRKNLEQIANVLGKPIQYFFGVEEMPIAEEIRKLTLLLAEKGADLETKKTIPLFTLIDKEDLEGQLKKSTKTYECPSWIIQKYPDVFACFLPKRTIGNVQIESNDIVYFTRIQKVRKSDFILVFDKGHYSIIRANGSSDSIGIVIALEKRYR